MQKFENPVLLMALKLPKLWRNERCPCCNRIHCLCEEIFWIWRACDPQSIQSKKYDEQRHQILISAPNFT